VVITPRKIGEPCYKVIFEIPVGNTQIDYGQNPTGFCTSRGGQVAEGEGRGEGLKGRKEDERGRGRSRRGGKRESMHASGLALKEYQ